MIFADALARLADEHADRLLVAHHIDDDSGVVTPSVVESFVADAGAADYYICGPAPFMDTVEATVLGPVSRANVSTSNASRSNRFLPTSPRRPEQTEEVVIELDRKTTTADYRAGNTCCRPRAWRACGRRRRAKQVPAERVWRASSPAAPGCSTTTRSTTTKWPKAGC